MRRAALFSSVASLWSLHAESRKQSKGQETTGGRGSIPPRRRGCGLQCFWSRIPAGKADGQAPFSDGGRGVLCAQSKLFQTTGVRSADDHAHHESAGATNTRALESGLLHDRRHLDLG